MLKKITVTAAVVMAVTLLAGIILLPLSLRSIVNNGDQILRSVFTSTPAASFDAKNYTEVLLETGYNTAVIVEQSAGDTVEVRAEGLMWEEMPLGLNETIEPGNEETPESRVMRVTLSNKDLFSKESALSSLLNRNIFYEFPSLYIIRIPSYLSLTVTQQPWEVRYEEDVHFANRSYYDNRKWEEERRNNVSSRPREQMGSKYEAIMTAFQSELDTRVSSLLLSQTAAPEEIDEYIDDIATEYYNRLSEQIFPYMSDSYDVDALLTLLHNYVDLQGQIAKQTFRIRLAGNSGDSELEQRLATNLQEIERLARNAKEAFDRYYYPYLDNAPADMEAPEEEPVQADDKPADPDVIILSPAQQGGSENAAQDAPGGAEPAVPGQQTESSSGTQEIRQSGSPADGNPGI